MNVQILQFNHMHCCKSQHFNNIYIYIKTGFIYSSEIFFLLKRYPKKKKKRYPLDDGCLKK